ncbi:S66 family peptidase [Agromyces marinus]|uniref:LD-carboxypeptidase n=1 Tax=Agromyces marinus TaxID=1389020 RepID=A0ABN6YC40_9MICO|nr:S66 peptidase family protein [Agromyces marinus]UIP60101.1 Microcin C7 self-immunity protein MccF [Agromyces marinus]BDZ54778.1 LD-carboxypeptidase [Agromyces marinus]
MASVELISPPKARPGDRIAVLSPSWAAPAYFPELHEQAMTRLTVATGLIPVEYPTTRRADATPSDRAADLMSAFADPSIRGILATIGGDDQILVIPHLDAELARRDPKPFVGYSDNTNLHNWLWGHGIASFYGGSTQVHLGAGPRVDDIHARSLRAALIDGGEIEITDPGESEDFGVPWDDARSLTEFPEREATEPWTWAGGALPVEGVTWGGCLEVLDQILVADRFPFAPASLEGAVLFIETSELVPPEDWVARIIRAIGERGLLDPLSAVVAARPPASSLESGPRTPQERADYRRAQRDAIITEVARYNRDAVVCVGPPFGHTRPQWVLPYGGPLALDPSTRVIRADFGRA